MPKTGMISCGTAETTKCWGLVVGDCDEDGDWVVEKEGDKVEEAEGSADEDAEVLVDCEADEESEADGESDGVVEMVDEGEDELV